MAQTPPATTSAASAAATASTITATPIGADTAETPSTAETTITAATVAAVAVSPSKRCVGSPTSVKLLGLLRDEVSNKLNAAQYEQTTWSARSWMAFQCQKISVALHKAAAMEIALELGLAAARAGGGED